MKYITLLALILTLSVPAMGTSNTYQSVRCSMQDKAGNIWFGTSNNGLYRYNGKSFSHFSPKDGLSGHNIGAILEDAKGTVWVGTLDSGLFRYDGKTFTDVSLPLPYNGYFPSTINPDTKIGVSSICQDKNGRIWLGTNSGVYSYNGQSFALLANNGLNLHNVQKIIADKQGNIWFSTWFGGVCRYDGRLVTSFKPNNEVWFAGLMEDNKGNIWVGRRSKGVCRFDGKTFNNVTQQGMLDQSCIYAMTQDQQGNIWFATEADDMGKRETMAGIWRYDGHAFKNFTSKDGLYNYPGFCILADRAGNIWVGTRNTELYRYNGKTFVNLSSKLGRWL